MNLTPHTAPKMDRAPRYRHQVASFRKNSMERLDVVIEEYNGLDLLNLSVTRDSSGQHSLKRMRGTARYISLQIKQLPQLLEALKEAEQLAIKRGLLGRPSEQGIYRND